MEFLNIIASIAHNLMGRNPELKEASAINQATKEYFNEQIELWEKLRQIKHSLGEQEWENFVTSFNGGAKTPEQLLDIYNTMIDSNEFINGITVDDIKLVVEKEGTFTQTILPAGSKVKISRAHWDNTYQFIEIWSAPDCVDYTLRQNVLAL
ncbi:hypothetical protein CAL7716_102430 (plasmid) [Calothrix sp. PCC 7716]|nr:hypothetical protein CAL7716_102430 [Calothrix sp. PCC 7716]